MNLTNRLQMVADLVRTGSRVADIGTDHAYLPTYLVLNNKIPSAIAADVRKGPLENARQTVDFYKVNEKIELRLSDGFDKLYYTEADDYVLAGMGGTLMASLIERTEWLKNPDLRLILQPQSHAEDVRKLLYESGFEILKETCAKEGKRVYSAFNVVFTGNAKKMPDSFYYFGHLTENEDELSQILINNTVSRLKKKKEALKKSGNDYNYIDNILRGVINDDG